MDCFVIQFPSISYPLFGIPGITGSVLILLYSHRCLVWLYCLFWVYIFVSFEHYWSRHMMIVHSIVFFCIICKFFPFIFTLTYLNGLVFFIMDTIFLHIYSLWYFFCDAIYHSWIIVISVDVGVAGWLRHTYFRCISGDSF